VAAGSAAALICDTGALLDYLVESAPDHGLFRRAIERARTRYVPGLVLAEVDYFLRYAGLGLSLVDGSVVALAEGLGIRRLATRDVRHFAAVRLRDAKSFELAVHPTSPDRS
jgi:predicted nucleic acid-binding protein